MLRSISQYSVGKWKRFRHYQMFLQKSDDTHVVLPIVIA